MLTISPLITLIAVLVIPLSAIFMGIVIKISQKYFKAQQKYLGKINGQVEEIYSGHRVVKAFGREESVIEEFDKTNDILFESAWKSQFLSGLMQPVMNLVGNLGYVARRHQRKHSGYQRSYQGRRYPGIHPVCEKSHSADVDAGSGIEYAPVHGRRCGTGF